MSCYEMDGISVPHDIDPELHATIAQRFEDLAAQYSPLVGEHNDGFSAKILGYGDGSVALMCDGPMDKDLPAHYGMVLGMLFGAGKMDASLKEPATQLYGSVRFACMDDLLATMNQFVASKDKLPLTSHTADIERAPASFASRV